MPLTQIYLTHLTTNSKRKDTKKMVSTINAYHCRQHETVEQRNYDLSTALAQKSVSLGYDKRNHTYVQSWLKLTKKTPLAGSPPWFARFISPDMPAFNPCVNTSTFLAKFCIYIAWMSPTLAQSLHIDHRNDRNSQHKQLSLPLRVCLPFLRLRTWNLPWQFTA